MRVRLRRLFMGCSLAVILAVAGGGAAPPDASDSPFAQRSARVAAVLAAGKINGMTVSTPRGSSVWAGDEMGPTIAELKSIGVNWIAIHPYGRIATDGTVSWSWRRRRGAPDSPQTPAAPSTPPDWIRRPIEEAHRQGIKILIKPHLANWRDFEWRGDIRFATAEEWDRFFSTYQAWIVAMARFSADADLFAVGTELGGTTDHEERWREVIAAVRNEYDGPLTYAANWDAYQRVGFWDALDAIGIQAYFPVLDESEVGSGRVPDQEVFDRGWRRIMAPVAAYSGAVGRPVVFTEAGYNNSPRAPFEPWDYRTRGEGEMLQVRCMIAALSAIAGEPSVRGSFLWKWYPGDRIPGDFAMAAPTIRRIIREHWGGDQN